MSIRRRLMMQVGKSDPYDAMGYIKYGKILHLDGLTKGNNENAWTDLAQGLIFNIYNNSTYGNITALTNGYSLPGLAQAYICASANATKIPNNQDATIEVCFKPTAIQRSFVFAKSASAYSPMFLISSGGGSTIRGLNSSIAMGDAGRTWSAGLQANQYYTASIEFDKAYLNGVACNLSSSTEGSWNMESQESYARVGSRRRGSGVGNGQDLYKGNVYAIRIYNRKLSEAEILNNQHVDNERFNLGLDI